jgi:hypothetical protein
MIAHSQRFLNVLEEKRNQIQIQVDTVLQVAEALKGHMKDFSDLGIRTRHNDTAPGDLRATPTCAESGLKMSFVSLLPSGERQTL